MDTRPLARARPPRPRDSGPRQPRPAPPPRPTGRRTGARLTLRLAFWAGLLICLGVWWVGTPPGSVDSIGSAFTELGRVTGMVAGYFLLLQILLMTRVGWLDRIVSANDLLVLHRDLGALLLLTTLLHAATLIVGYSIVDGVGPWSESVTVVTTYPDMISALVATAILVSIGLLAVRRLRARLPYEVWYRLHLTSYAVLLLGYGHQFAAGRDLAEPGWPRLFWLGCYAFVLACLVWGRLIAPARLNLRHRLRVAEVAAESDDMFSVYVSGRRLGELDARAGQFFRWRFLARGSWSQAHPFSLSAAPNQQWLRLTIKAVGEHTTQLRWLEPGTRVIVSGPAGAFTADRRVRHRALLVAGGSGIAPIRALLEDLPRGSVVVVYRASSPDDLIFREELDWLATVRDAEVHYVIGGRDDPGPRAVMSTRGLRRLVPDLQRRDVYLCGPEGLVTSAVKLLRRLHVPRRQIHLDPFEF